jgi:2-oxoisovalerate dehydrogenase E1 component
MPKSIIVEPKAVFSKSSIHFSDIPINAYDRSMKEELAQYSTEDFLHIWQDMCAIREFESILNEIKIKGAYKGVTYNHAGPAHLSIGQEAAAVGMAFLLSRNPRQGFLQYPQTPRRAAFGDHEDLS